MTGNLIIEKKDWIFAVTLDGKMPTNRYECMADNPEYHVERRPFSEEDFTELCAFLKDRYSGGPVAALNLNFSIHRFSLFSAEEKSIMLPWDTFERRLQKIEGSNAADNLHLRTLAGVAKRHGFKPKVIRRSQGVHLDDVVLALYPPEEEILSERIPNDPQILEEHEPWPVHA